MNLVNSGRLALALQLAWPPCAPARAAWLACAAFTATLPCLCKGPAPPLHSLPLLSPPFSCSLSQPALAVAMAAIAAERSSSFRCCSRLAATVQPCLCWPSQAPAHPLPYFAASRPSSRARPACSVHRCRGCTWLDIPRPMPTKLEPCASARRLGLAAALQLATGAVLVGRNGELQNILCCKSTSRTSRSNSRKGKGLSVNL